MEIQWYPGHMTKARRLLREQIKLIDIVLEVKDARIPISSSNPDLIDLIGNKEHVIVLNKSDLATKEGNQQWLTYYAQKNIQAISIAAHSKNVKKLISLISRITTDEDRRRRLQGMNPRAKRVMVVGIPNVGKSSLINNLAGKRTMKIADKPGLTKGNHWIRVRKDLELLDTPGILWPKFSSKETGVRLALTGAIRHEVYDQIQASKELIAILDEINGDLLADTYSVDIDVGAAPQIKLEKLGERWGFLSHGGIIDLEKSASRLLQEFRQGKLGRITLEYPEDLSD